MRRSLKVRIGTLVLAAGLALPVVAAPARGDNPVDPIERIIARVVKQIRHIIQLGDNIQPPK